LGKNADVYPAIPLKIVENVSAYLNEMGPVSLMPSDIQDLATRANTIDTQFGIMQVAMDLYWFLPAPAWRRFALTRHVFEVRGPGCYLQSKAEIVAVQKAFTKDSSLQRILSRLRLQLRGYWFFAVEHGDCGIRKWVKKYGMDDVIADMVTRDEILAAYPEDRSKREAYKAVLGHLQGRCRSLRGD